MQDITIKLLIQKLNRVLNNEVSREEIASWAVALISEDIDVKDPQAWELLKTIGGLDIETIPDEYLYDETDIRTWIEEYS